MARIDFHPEAAQELEVSAEWYLERSSAAAKGFALAVEAALRKIPDNPERFPRIGRRHRACNLENYPFQIVYRRDGCATATESMLLLWHVRNAALATGGVDPLTRPEGALHRSWRSVARG